MKPTRRNFLRGLLAVPFAAKVALQKKQNTDVLKVNEPVKPIAPLNKTSKFTSYVTAYTCSGVTSSDIGSDFYKD